MASKARAQLEESLSDIDSLLDFHGALTALSEADGEPIPDGADVLFRSAVVLLVSHWEAYVEDICSEAVSHIVTHAANASTLPKEIKQQVAAELKKAPNELELWQVADGGWRSYLESRLVAMRDTRNRNFNTPKAQQSADFFQKAMGLSDVRKSWDFDKLSPEENAAKLDELIEIRGSIAHRGRVSSKIDKEWVEQRTALVRKIAGKTGGRINSHVKKITTKALWE